MFAPFAAATTWTALAHGQHQPAGAGAMPGMPAMTHAEPERPLGLPMAREASGTAWQPDTTPLHAFHWMLGDWMLMLHGNLFVMLDAQGSRRGATQVSSVNWLMFMAEHPLGPGTVTLRTMLSAEPLTVGSAGYPLLLQTGETYQGAPLHDRQHPHDLFMELAALYALPVSDDVALQLYVAPSGEPAIGPVAFPHRASAFTDPLAPISHHWQDATHISFGVLTAGVFARRFKIEGSWFNGREPDENRWDIDLRVPDSYSGRVWYVPCDCVVMQASYAYLSSPEVLAPGQSVHRVTASVQVQANSDDVEAAATLVGGLNVSAGVAEPSGLLESNVDIGSHHTLFGRAELVVKSGEELVLADALADSHFLLGQASLGYAFRFPPVAGLVSALGAMGSVSFVDRTLSGYYGSTVPVGGVIFLQVHPAQMHAMQ
jgi:hypothetical protein